MPAKPSFTHHLILHPEGGINEVEVGSFSRWVGAWGAKLTRHCFVLEQNKRDGQHGHIALEFKTLKRQDDLKKQLRKDLPFIIQDERWTKNPFRSLVLKAHDDINGLVGGYFDKSANPKTVSIAGFNETQLREGKVRRDEAVEKKEKLICNKMKLVPLLIRYHHTAKNDSNATIQGRPYYHNLPERQVEYCFERLIHDGYVNYLHHWTPTLRNNTIKYWIDLISAT